jgi:hypothetical protein
MVAFLLDEEPRAHRGRGIIQGHNQIPRPADAHSWGAILERLK